MRVKKINLYGRGGASFMTEKSENASSKLRAGCVLDLKTKKFRSQTNGKRRNKMKRNRLFVIVAVFVAVFAVSAPQTVLAAGTTANTSAANTVVVDWNAGAVAYSTTDTASFVVDRLVTFTVTNQTAVGLTVDVYPGVAGASPTTNVMAFDVANLSNTALDFTISALNTGNAVTSNLPVYWDDDRNGAYDGTEPLASPLDDIPADSTWRVFVVADISSAALTTWVENIDLRAQALTTAGVVITASAGAWEATTLQSVLADGSGTAAADTTYDGYHSDRGYYYVISPSLTVSKTISSVNDARPFNTPDPKAIPGATVRYRIVVDNAGSGDADAVTLQDTLSGNIDVLDVTVISSSAGSAPTLNDTNPDTILWSVGTVASGTSENLVYDVVIP
jgi:uncharacterized repeat protein (TIGR01451 family)